MIQLSDKLADQNEIINWLEEFSTKSDSTEVNEVIEYCRAKFLSPSAGSSPISHGKPM